MKVMPTLSRIRVAQALQDVFLSSRRVGERWDDGLQDSDASLAQAMLGLCLRNWGRLGAWVLPKLKNPSRGIPVQSRIPLSIGLAQLAWLPGVSTHAAVNETVDLMGDKQLGFPPHRGLCNAILRKAAEDREGLARELAALDPALDRSPFGLQALNAALHPRGQGAELERFWEKIQRPPRPAFHVLSGEEIPEGMEPDSNVAKALRLKDGAPFPRTWLMNGEGMVQDLSSQALMSFKFEGSPKRILDACAAPGGKTTLLSRRFPDADILALESDPKRAKRLESNLTQRKVKCRVQVEDAIAFLHKTQEMFDLILVDAPCSGTGTLRKHPELNWIGGSLDVNRLVLIQKQLLDAAIKRLAPGGTLIYAVCSYLPQEGRHHLDRVLSAHPDIKALPLWPEAWMIQGQIFQPDPLIWEGEGFQAFALASQG